VSYESRKGYDAEHLVEMYLQALVPGCYRPRAGAVDDVGDIAGCPGGQRRTTGWWENPAYPRRSRRG
jgi:hypothetical protein